MLNQNNLLIIIHQKFKFSDLTINIVNPTVIMPGISVSTFSDSMIIIELLNKASVQHFV